MEFNNKLRMIRVLRGWSQLDLASKSGIDRSVIARCENQSGMPRPKTLMVFARSLHVPVEWLMDRKPFVGVYRPVSPYRTFQPGPAMDRIVDDLTNLLPKFVDEMEVNTGRWHVCQLGAVLTCEGTGAILLISTNEVAGGLQTVLDYETVSIDEELFLSLLLDPATTLERDALPEDFRKFRGCDDLHLYKAPVEAVEVQLEIRGRKTADIEAAIRGVFNDDLLRLQIETKGNFREHLPDGIRSWLEVNGVSIDGAGQLVKA